MKGMDQSCYAEDEFFWQPRLTGYVMHIYVKCKVLLNGQPRGDIVRKRGIRQGDMLSPFIFNICMEALGGLLNHENQMFIPTWTTYDDTILKI